jgi:hypothetical protein
MELPAVGVKGAGAGLFMLATNAFEPDGALPPPLAGLLEAGAEPPPIDLSKSAEPAILLYYF